MIAQIVRFSSEMTEDEVQKMYENRAPRYRALSGLKQKYYLKFPDTDEFGAVYLWESKEDLAKFRKSELCRTIPTAYKVQGTTDVQLAELVMTLRTE